GEFADAQRGATRRIGVVGVISEIGALGSLEDCTGAHRPEPIVSLDQWGASSFEEGDPIAIEVRPLDSIRPSYSHIAGTAHSPTAGIEGGQQVVERVMVVQMCRLNRDLRRASRKTHQRLAVPVARLVEANQFDPRAVATKDQPRLALVVDESTRIDRVVIDVAVDV